MDKITIAQRLALGAWALVYGDDAEENASAGAGAGGSVDSARSGGSGGGMYMYGSTRTAGLVYEGPKYSHTVVLNASATDMVIDLDLNLGIDASVRNSKNASVRSISNRNESMGMGGTRVVVHFTNTGGNGSDPSRGLDIRATDGFELNSACGWGGSWVPAEIIASNATAVTLESRSFINKAVGVRYAYYDTPCFYKRCAVYNAAGLPLTPLLELWA